MSRVLNLIPNAVGQSQRDLMYMEVSMRQPAPASLSDPLHLVCPDWNPDIVFSITDWPACHGSALPSPGDQALVVKDDREEFRCVWWGSAQGTEPQRVLATGAGHTVDDVIALLQLSGICRQD